MLKKLRMKNILFSQNPNGISSLSFNAFRTAAEVFIAENKIRKSIENCSLAYLTQDTCARLLSCLQ